MKTTLRPLVLSALIALTAYSGSAYAFTIKGMTAGMSVDAIQKLFPHAQWKKRAKNVLVVEDGKFLYLTVGGYTVNQLAVMSFRTENRASEISLHIDCGIEPFNFIKLLSNRFGRPVEIRGREESKFIIATWVKNHKAMRMLYGQTSPCYMLNLYDEDSTKSLLEMDSYVEQLSKEMREGKLNDF